MIPKKSLDSVLDKSIILTKTAPNDNAKSISVQCAPVLTALSSFERFSRFLLMNIDQYRSVLLVFTLLNDVCLVLFGILGSWITNRPLSTLKTSSHAIIQHNMSILQVLRSQQIKYNQGVCM